MADIQGEGVGGAHYSGPIWGMSDQQVDGFGPMGWPTRAAGTVGCGQFRRVVMEISRAQYARQEGNCLQMPLD